MGRLFFRPQAKTLLAKLVPFTTFDVDLLWPPVDGKLAESVEQPLLLHHGQVAFATLLDAAVVVPHGPGQLLVVHLDAAIRLHQSPRACKVVGVVHPEDAVGLVYPADHAWVVEPVVQQVSNKDIDRRKRNLRRMLTRSASFSASVTL